MEKLIVFSTHQYDLELAQGAAAPFKMDVFSVTDIKSLGQAIQETPPKAVFVDAEDGAQVRFFTDFMRKMSAGSAAVFAPSTHLIFKRTKKRAIPAALQPYLRNAIIRSESGGKYLGHHYAKAISAVLAREPRTLPQLMGKAAAIQILSLKQAKNKSQLVDELQVLLVENKVLTKIASMIAFSLDELIMNAIFDAPIDMRGNRTNRRLKRSADFELSETAQVDVAIAVRPDMVGICVTDRFGSMDLKAMTRSVESALVGNIVVQDKDAGAGIGLASIFAAGGSILLQSVPGEKTQVTVFYATPPTLLEFRKQGSFFAGVVF